MFGSDADMRRRVLLAWIGLAAALPRAAIAAEEMKMKSGGESYLPVDSITGATNRGGGRRGVLTVDCGLDIPDPKLREQADKLMPRLHAAYLQTVLTYAAGLTPGTPPNPLLIAQSLQRQTDLVLGRPGARLLLGAVVSN